MERQQRVAATASHDSLLKPSKVPVKGRRETEREADQLGRPISKYLQQAQNHQQDDDDEDSDEMEEYFSEEEYRSLNNEPGVATKSFFLFALRKKSSLSG